MASITAGGSKIDWSMILGGVLLFVMGAICLFWPGITLITIAIMVGCALIAASAFDFVVYFRMRNTAQHSGWTLVNAILDLILGALFLANPVIAAEAITFFLGVLLICYGVFAFAMSFSLSKVTGKWWIMLINGIISVLCGVLFFISPAFFAIYLAAFLIVRGITMVCFGFMGQSQYMV